MSVKFDESDKNIENKPIKRKNKSYKMSKKAILDLKKFNDENYVEHIDGDVRNNMLSNLKVISQK